MKFLRLLPVLFFFAFASCNQEKEMPKPVASADTENSAARAGICDKPAANTYTPDQISAQLSWHLNCVTPICEYAVPMTYKHEDFIVTSSHANGQFADPETYSSTEINAMITSASTIANQGLPAAQAICPSAIISGYQISKMTVPMSNPVRYYLKVTVSYSCCNGKPVE